MAYKFDVALSFAGEQRTDVERVASCLKAAGLRVFYDIDEKADLWGKDLYVHLSDVYQNQAQYCIIFASREYAQKNWTSHERQNAQARALREKGNEYILPVRFDDTDIPGMPSTIGYLDFRREGPEGICKALSLKLAASGSNTLTAVSEIISGGAPQGEVVDRIRRQLIAALVTLGVPSAVGGIVTTYRFIAESHQKRDNEQARVAQNTKANQELRELRCCYFLPVLPNSGLRCKIPMLPGMKDPWGPPERRFSGSGNLVMEAYLDAFGPWQYEIAPELPTEVKDDDAPVVIASHLVNELAQKYFGDPTSPTPILSPQVHDAKGAGFEAKLRWTIYTPGDAAPLTKIELFEGKPTVRKSVRHAVADRDGSPDREPMYYQQGDIAVQTDDYLLVTALPRDSRFDRRIVSLAGVSKCGTLAARFLFGHPDVANSIVRGIHQRVHAAPDYFQALIKVWVDHRLRGNPQPTMPTLIDATPIDVIRL